MPFWSKKSKGSAEESPEQTLARLAREDLTRSPRAANRNLRLQRGGYDVAEVDAFLATVHRRSSDEIRNVRFNTTRRGQAYNEDDVDRLLDEIASG